MILDDLSFPLISSRMYQETALIVLAFLGLGSALSYTLKKKHYFFFYSWASLKGWLIVAPLFFLLFGLPEPWPFVTLALLSVLGIKVFFQILGMFHRSYFVWSAYAGIMVLAYFAYNQNSFAYHFTPLALWGITSLIPLVRNSYKKMIQYMALTNMGFVYLGWAFLHLAWILKLPGGLFQFMYLVILTEFCDNTNLALSYGFGRIRLFERIDRRRSLEGFVTSVLLTIMLAFGMRHLLPTSSEIYWLSSGLVASFGGILGDLVMTVIRKDAGIHRLGPFIIGRGDFLSRMDRMIFVAPIYYYLMTWIIH